MPNGTLYTAALFLGSTIRSKYTLNCSRLDCLLLVTSLEVALNVLRVPTSSHESFYSRVRAVRKFREAVARNEVEILARLDTYVH